ncbi:hypothetical protein [Spiroplasma endosymbiont of Polydrusus pterygomalis]|uniref:hypothetical protein n=1 Tax=Spiroplasma endosymbiont of Polydrusus pterygomalis TaxID=3139327 RepID=UPI003CCB2585
MTEIEKLLVMNYENACNYLKNKYGHVAKDYFMDETMTKAKIRQSIKRGKEGLYIHHIDEDKAIKLSTPKYAQLAPFTFQKANRLVYCNLLEHLVLHIKIVESTKSKYGCGGIYAYIVPELNDIYSGIQYQQPWKQKVSTIILPLKQDYLKCIKKLVDLDFPYPLLSSFNDKFQLWESKNNNQLYNEMKKLGVKY